MSSWNVSPGGSRRFISETDFVFNSNRWMTRVLPVPHPFSPRYTLSFLIVIIQLLHIYSGSCESLVLMWPAVSVCVAHIHTRVCMQMANLADADVSEEDKIRVMMNQAICESMKWVCDFLLRPPVRFCSIYPNCFLSFCLYLSVLSSYFVLPDFPYFCLFSPHTPYWLHLSVSLSIFIHFFIHSKSIFCKFHFYYLSFSFQLQQEAWCCSSSQLHLLPLWKHWTPHQKLSHQCGKSRTGEAVSVTLLHKKVLLFVSVFTFLLSCDKIICDVC